MKSFLQLSEKMSKGMPKGIHVFDTKVKGIEVMVHKEGGKFSVYVDREKLDTFRDLNSAKKAGLEFVKQYKG